MVGSTSFPSPHYCPTGPRAADMDGDMDLDVVVGFTTSDAIAWYENDGAGRTALDGGR